MYFLPSFLSFILARLTPNHPQLATNNDCTDTNIPDAPTCFTCQVESGQVTQSFAENAFNGAIGTCDLQGKPVKSIALSASASATSPPSLPTSSSNALQSGAAPSGSQAPSVSGASPPAASLVTPAKTGSAVANRRGAVAAALGVVVLSFAATFV
ncbi:hypothetical protein K438DRAFT_1952528 [Mycena galopus ATCC 62051]|nr:hypothetical protein K438DRAFT_1952528 [Mycena galopus ATCC 62051]